MEMDRRSIADGGDDRGLTVQGERLIELSSWMVVLGTIRVICAYADYLGALFDAYRFEPVSMRMLSRFVEENHPIVALSAAWPLLLGMALRRTRWHELLPAAGVTFLMLSFGGVMELTAEWNQSRADGVTFGSFHVSRRAFLHPTLSDVALGLLGTTQLVFELATALRCLLLANRARGVQAQRTESGKQQGARKARFGRLAVYASLGFLVVMIRLPVWSTYLELLNDSRFVREFILKNDIKGNKSPQTTLKLTKEEARLRNLRIVLAEGSMALEADRFLEAREAYLQIISQTESSAGSSLPRVHGPLIATAENNLAWLLATCPMTELRDPQAAVAHARRAVELGPQEGNYWNTLGVAHYRAGEWDEAKTALHRSIELRDEGDSFDWFFLALVHLKQGRKEQARDWYDKAVRWYQQHLPYNRELYRFQVEAAHELGLPKLAPRPFPPTAKRRFR